jgi:hypothetical protein
VSAVITQQYIRVVAARRVHRVGGASSAPPYTQTIRGQVAESLSARMSGAEFGSETVGRVLRSFACFSGEMKCNRPPCSVVGEKSSLHCVDVSFVLFSCAFDVDHNYVVLAKFIEINNTNNTNNRNYDFRY